MKVLIVASGNSGRISPFVQDQASALIQKGVKIDFFLIKGKGILGYLKNYFKLVSTIRNTLPDIIHAHYGFAGLLSVLQTKVPVVTTFHGSDINVKKNLKFSFLASKLSARTIFVHPSQPAKLKYTLERRIIPCGVDTHLFKPGDGLYAREKMKLSRSKQYALFSSSFDNQVKNYPLAKAALQGLNCDIELIELKGYSRRQVALLLNAVNLLIVTSYSETGPVIVKEAMACNCPIVSVDVGDVGVTLGDTDLCWVVEANVESIREAVNSILSNTVRRSIGRERIMNLGVDGASIAERVKEVYIEMSERA